MRDPNKEHFDRHQKDVNERKKRVLLGQTTGMYATHVVFVSGW